MRVYHDPTHPADAVLVRGIASGTWFLVVFAFVWWTFLIGFVLIGFAGTFGASPVHVEHVAPR